MKDGQESGMSSKIKLAANHISAYPISNYITNYMIVNYYKWKTIFIVKLEGDIRV